jgi:hypothetical protein
MKEKFYELRVAIYKLLSNFAPRKPGQLVMVLRKLIENLSTFREDAPWIYKTIKKVFEKNKKYQIDVLNEILFSDQVNIVQEKDTKDPEAVVRIIL